MPLPDNLTPVTVYGAVLSDSGAPMSGTVQFVRSIPLTDSASGTVLAPGIETATLDASGAMSIPLIATDDPALSPSGWTYQVVVNLTGPAASDRLVQSYPALLPVAGAPSVKYTDLTKVAAPAQVLSLVTLDGDQTITGAKTFTNSP